MGDRNYAIESMISEVSALASGDEDEDQDVGTPTAQRRCDESASSGAQADLGRLSMSEANLRSKTADVESRLGKKSHSQMSIGGSKRNLVPIGATLRENKELKNQIQLCRSELQVANYKEREARGLLSKDVNDIMEEFYSLQLKSLETDEKLRQLSEIQATLHQVTAERDYALRNLEEFKEKTNREMNYYEVQMEKLNKQLESGRTHESGGLDDFTLASTVADPDLVEVQQKLKDALDDNTNLLDVNSSQQKEIERLTKALNEGQVKSALDKTNFVIGNSEREQELLLKIDALETDSKAKESTMTGVIQTLLQSESALKKKVERYQRNVALNDTPSFVFSDRDQMLAQVAGLESELSQLRIENRNMRKECARIMGVEWDSIAETQPSTENIDNDDDPSATSRIDNHLTQMRNMKENMKANYGLDFNFSDEGAGVDDIVDNNASTSFSGRPHLSIIGNNNGGKKDFDLGRSFGNVSFADVLQISMHTSEDVRKVKVKLGTLKDILVSMFERLRGSAVVLEEVYKFLSCGSSSNGDIVDKIRKMKFEFAAMASKDSAVEKAVAAAETSMTQLQCTLSVFEQSLNQTASFIMETTRHYSIAHNRSTAQERYDIDSNGAAEYDRVICELQEKLSLEEINMQEMKNLVSETKTKLSEVTDARDKALSSVDTLRRNLHQANDENIALKGENLALVADLQVAKASATSLEGTVQEYSSMCEDLNERLANTEERLRRSRKDLEKADHRQRELEHERQHIKQERSELAQKLVLTTDNLLSTKNILDDSAGVYEELRRNHEECRATLAQLERENHELKGRCADSEELGKKNLAAVSKEVDRLIEDCDAAKEAESQLRVRVAKLDRALDGYESRDIKLSRGPNGVLEFSCLSRINIENKITQTDITKESLEDITGHSEQNQRTLDRLHDVYSELATAIYSYVSPCPPPPELYKKQICDVESASRQLVELLFEAHQKNKLVLEQLDDILEQQKKSGGMVQGSAKFKHLETAIEPHKYSTKLRQDFYLLTTLSRDLTANLKNVEIMLRPQNKVDLIRIINDSRKLRQELYDRLEALLLTKSDKENMVPQTAAELMDMNKILRIHNNDLHAALKATRGQLEDIKNDVSKRSSNPDLAGKIQEEISKIEKVMSYACDGIRNVPRK